MKETRKEMLTIFEQAHLDAKLEGKIEGKIDDIQIGLARRYPKRPAKLDDQIAKLKDPDQIRAIFDLVYFDLAPIDEIARRVKEFTSAGTSKRRRRPALV